MVEKLQTLDALRSWTVGNYDNSEHTDPPAFAYPSSNIVYSVNHTSLLFLDVQPMQYHDIPVSAVTVTNPLWERNAFLYTIPVPLVLCILLLLYSSSCRLVLSLPIFDSAADHPYMLEQNDKISKEALVLISHWLISLTALEDYAVLKQPIPYFLIFHPPPQRGLPAFSLKHPLSHSISLVNKQSHN
jgi:hypothetical protein